MSQEIEYISTSTFRTLGRMANKGQAEHLLCANKKPHLIGTNGPLASFPRWIQQTPKTSHRKNNSKDEYKLNKSMKTPTRCRFYTIFCSSQDFTYMGAARNPGMDRSALQRE